MRGLIERVKMNRRQKAYTRKHREQEHGDGFRLVQLDDYPMPTFMGRRPWCDAILQDCPHPAHGLCCYCTHTDRSPYRDATADALGGDRG